MNIFNDKRELIIAIREAPSNAYAQRILDGWLIEQSKGLRKKNSVEFKLTREGEWIEED